jgi:hypothetical protein
VALAQLVVAGKECSTAAGSSATVEAQASFQKHAIRILAAMTGSIAAIRERALDAANAIRPEYGKHDHGTMATRGGQSYLFRTADNECGTPMISIIWG